MWGSRASELLTLAIPALGGVERFKGWKIRVTAAFEFIQERSIKGDGAAGFGSGMDSVVTRHAAPFPSLKGEMARRVSEFDWKLTPLGPISRWPQTLKTTVGIVLLSPVPIVMLSGEEGIMIYNDAYSVFAGGRHPRLLGSKVREGWPEVADFNDHVMKVGLARGTLAYRDQQLTLYRSGVPEQVWMKSRLFANSS